MTDQPYSSKRSNRSGSSLTDWLTPLMLALLFLAGGLFWDDWQWQRTAIAEGQWWRLLTGQFAHATWAHGVSNFAAVAIAALIAPRWLNGWPGMLLLFPLAAGVGLGIWWFNPDIAFYHGFSGIGHGWMMVAFAWSPYLSPWPKVLAVVIIQSKVVWEDSTMYQLAQFSGYFTDADVLTDAHWYGVLLALPVVLAYFVVRFYQDRAN